MGRTKTADFKTSHVVATETFSGSLATGQKTKIEVGRDEEDKPIFETHEDRESVSVSKRDVLPADEPVVQAYPHFFREFERDRPGVEAATAAPGEKRG